MRIASREKQKRKPKSAYRIPTRNRQTTERHTSLLSRSISRSHTQQILIFPARLFTFFFLYPLPLLFLPCNSNNDSFNVSILAVTDSTARHSLHLYFMFPVFISPFSNFSCCHNWQPKQRTRSGKTLFENEKKK